MLAAWQLSSNTSMSSGKGGGEGGGLRWWWWRAEGAGAHCLAVQNELGADFGAQGRGPASPRQAHLTPPAPPAAPSSCRRAAACSVPAGPAHGDGVWRRSQRGLWQLAAGCRVLTAAVCRDREGQGLGRGRDARPPPALVPAWPACKASQAPERGGRGEGPRACGCSADSVSVSIWKPTASRAEKSTTDCCRSSVREICGRRGGGARAPRARGATVGPPGAPCILRAVTAAGAGPSRAWGSGPHAVAVGTLWPRPTCRNVLPECSGQKGSMHDCLLQGGVGWGWGRCGHGWGHWGEERVVGDGSLAGLAGLWPCYGSEREGPKRGSARRCSTPRRRRQPPGATLACGAPRRPRNRACGYGCGRHARRPHNPRSRCC